MAGLSKKSITIFILLLCMLLPSAHAEVGISLINAPQELELPGQPMKLVFQITNPEINNEFYLLTSLDNKSNFIKPDKIDINDETAVLSFEFPAPILTLEYFLLVKRDSVITKRGQQFSLQRNCIPKLDDHFDVDINTSRSTADKQLLSNTKELENDFGNYEASTNQLSEIIQMMGW